MTPEEKQKRALRAATMLNIVLEDVLDYVDKPTPTKAESLKARVAAFQQEERKP